MKYKIIDEIIDMVFTLGFAIFAFSMSFFIADFLYSAVSITYLVWMTILWINHFIKKNEIPVVVDEKPSACNDHVTLVH